MIKNSNILPRPTQHDVPRFLKHFYMLVTATKDQSKAPCPRRAYQLRFPVAQHELNCFPCRFFLVQFRKEPLTLFTYFSVLKNSDDFLLPKIEIATHSNRNSGGNNSTSF